MGDLKTAPGSDAVHLCIDMQRLFAADGPWPTPWMQRVLPIVVSIVERSPARTVFTRFVTPASAADMPGMWQRYYDKWADMTRARLDKRLFDLVSPLEKYAPPAVIFNRMRYSAFAGGALHEFLRGKSVDTLIVTGSETDVCVLSSVLAAVDLGYRIIVVRDALCSSSDESHDALLGLYRRRFDVQIELAAAAEVLETWPG